MTRAKEINILLVFNFFFLLSIVTSCQKSESQSLIKIANLPSLLDEISGITILKDNHLYAINDSGNDNTLFCLNQQGEILSKIKIPNSKNVDWEDLAYDKENTIYIGDFGNNRNKRKKLKIYKVTGILANDISVSEIRFVFEDQKKFPPKNKNLNFDVEAFVCLNRNLYLFTKDRSSKQTKITKIYKIPAVTGNHTAKLIGKFEIGKNPSNCLITAAAINESADKVVLLTHNKLFLLSNFKNDDLLGGDITKMKLDHYSQKEGVCFKNDSTLFITDEKTGQKRATLYKFAL